MAVDQGYNAGNHQLIARMTNPDVARRNAYQAVKARPFTRACGKPTWETKEGFLAEARETSMIFDQVTYDWCGEYGLLAKIEGGKDTRHSPA